MPPGVTSIRRKVQKLHKICLKVVVKNFDKIVADPLHEHYLATNWSQELLTEFREARRYLCVSKEHALFIINPWLNELYLNFFDPSDLPVILNKLETIKETSTISSIYASFKKKISLDILWQITRSLPSKLLDLNLSGTDVNDEMLEIIAGNCPQLQKLNLRSCKEFKSFGLKAFCCKNGEVCQNDVLQSLDLSETLVGKEGVEFALAHFPNLLELKHDALVKIMYEMHREDHLNNMLLKTYNLKSVNVHRTSYSYCDILRMLNTLCPNITDLELYIQDQTEIDTAALFTSLTKVHLNMNNFSNSCTILPFLKVKGNSLASLYIKASAKFSVSVEPVVELCSSLTQLALVNVTFEKIRPSALRDLKYTLPHLKGLAIVSANQKTLKDSLSYVISRSPNLKSLEFYSSGVFKASSFIDFLVHCNCMSSVEQMELCGIDLKSVTKLIEQAPEFKVNIGYYEHNV